MFIGTASVTTTMHGDAVYYCTSDAGMSMVQTASLSQSEHETNTKRLTESLAARLAWA